MAPPDRRALRFPPAHGGPVGDAWLRSTPDDFRVDEELGFEPCGEGEHVWLWVRKRGANTEDVARAVAALAGVRRRAVGCSGMKDRHADTGQWFSVHLPGLDEPDWSRLDPAVGRVQTALRHTRKLRTGSHRANRFVLRLRGVTAERAATDERLAAVRSAGFPNYFGPQRFGHGGENLHRARRQLAGAGTGRVRGIQLSAARAWLFNRVLAARVGAGCWVQPLAGDALMLAGTHSVFEYRGDEADVAARLAALDLHVTGPLWGSGRQPLSAAASARERAWLSEEESLCAGLERVGVQARRRALRAVAHDLTWAWDGNDLELRVTLGRGVFATSLLDEVLVAYDATRANE